MLDTFAKRLNSQLRPSPGDIDRSDRWAVGGHVRPTDWSAGAIVATLGALTAAFVGTHESPEAANFLVDDRIRTQLVPYPGDLEDVRNRYAIAGHFLFIGEDDENTAGFLDATLGGLAASFPGTFTAPPDREGAIEAVLGGIDLSFVGESYYRLFYDIEWSLTPTIEFQEIPLRSGALSATLGALTAAYAGTVLPPDSTTGRVSTTLGALSANLLGTFTAPANRDGLVHVDLSGLVGGLFGTSVPANSSIGSVSATLGGLSSSLQGSFAAWITDGQIETTLGALAPAFPGMFIQAGAIVGLVDSDLGGVTVSLTGTLADPPSHQTPKQSRVVRAGRKTRTARVKRRDRDYDA